MNTMTLSENTEPEITEINESWEIRYTKTPNGGMLDKQLVCNITVNSVFPPTYVFVNDWCERSFGRILPSNGLTGVAINNWSATLLDIYSPANINLIEMNHRLEFSE